MWGLHFYLVRPEQSSRCDISDGVLIIKNFQGSMMVSERGTCVLGVTCSRWTADVLRGNRWAPRLFPYVNQASTRDHYVGHLWGYRGSGGPRLLSLFFVPSSVLTLGSLLIRRFSFQPCGAHDFDQAITFRHATTLLSTSAPDYFLLSTKKKKKKEPNVAHCGGRNR